LAIPLSAKKNDLERVNLNHRANALSVYLIFHLSITDAATDNTSVSKRTSTKTESKFLHGDIQHYLAFLLAIPQL